MAIGKGLDLLIICLFMAREYALTAVAVRFALGIESS
jgi:hypothetical protein